MKAHALLEIGHQITVARLNKEMGLTMNPKQDWLYYARELVIGYAKHLRSNEADLLEFLHGALAPGLPKMELDQHLGDFNYHLEEILKLVPGILRQAFRRI